MAKLYYGNGSVTIEGSDIRGVQIKYRGAVEITKTAGDNFALVANDKGIIIFPVGEGSLGDLFSYEGEIIITSILASNNNGEKVSCTIKRVMDYTELLDGNTEDMTTNSEDMKAGYLYGKRVKKTKYDNILTNQHSQGELYLKDGSVYNGDYYHVHLDTLKAMTGATHSEESQDLYILRIADDKLIKTGTAKTRKAKITFTGGRGGGGSTSKGGY